MTKVGYAPTVEQQAVILHEGNAFVRACPGAGKTRTMVERARRILSNPIDYRGVAFLSFTNAAVEELDARLRNLGILLSPVFPSFIGTFDRFLWQFFIAPFGIVGCSQRPKLVPDKSKWEVKPFGGAQALKLEHFDCATGAILHDKVTRIRFKPKYGPRAWESKARSILEHARSEGLLDFDDVRAHVAIRLKDKGFAARLGSALSGRFREIVVDEAQDCNPTDLGIIDWLRTSGTTLKVVCDPSQAIYGFRGGLTDQLAKFETTFASDERLPMSGNFRSSAVICAAISKLRPPTTRGAPDEALGKHKDETTPVYILSYSGTAVPHSIGKRFQTLAANLGIPPAHAPVLAATWRSAGKAVGRAVPDAGNNKTLLLAEAVMGFHFAFAAGNRRDALARLHRVVLQVQGHITSAGEYTNFVTAGGIDDGRWRPEVIAIGQALKVASGERAADWLDRARALLGANVVGTPTIRQRLPFNKQLEAVLAEESPNTLPARTIHSVKGLEFPAVCVVLTTQTAGGILDVLSGASADSDAVEDARELYVAASRAERLLAIAVPRSRAATLKSILDPGGNDIEILTL